MTAGRFLIRQNNPALQQFFHGLLGGETPIFRRESFIQAELQGAQMALHDAQQ